MSKGESLTGPISIAETTRRFVRHQWIGPFTGEPLTRPSAENIGASGVWVYSPTGRYRTFHIMYSGDGIDWRKVNEPISETIARLDRVIADVRHYQ